MSDTDELPAALIVMWLMTAATLIFLLVRLFTRMFVIDRLGLDDHIYMLAAALLVLSTTFTHIAACFGFGRSLEDLAPADASQAIKWEMVAHTLLIAGTAVSKLSLGLFLLRLTTTPRHRIYIWSTLGSLFLCSLVAAMVLWLRCGRPAASYDARIREDGSGTCTLEFPPAITTVCVLSLASDVVFTVFPIRLVWDSEIARREKICISYSLGLGVLVGAAAVVRTYEAARGLKRTYTHDNIHLIMWTCIEQALTMICTGIPLLRPLYRRLFRLSESSPEGHRDNYVEAEEGGEGREMKHEKRNSVTEFTRKVLFLIKQPGLRHTGNG